MTDILPKTYEVEPKPMTHDERWEAAEVAALETREILLLASSLEGNPDPDAQEERERLMAQAEQEFTTVYLLTHRDMSPVARRHITVGSNEGKEVLVDEAVQDSYRRIFTGLVDFERRSKVSTWMYRIVANAAINVSKREQRQQHDELDHVAIDTGISDQLIDFGEVDNTAEQLYRLEIIGQALLAITPRQRAVVVLRAYYDMDYATIGEELGISETAAKVRFCRARKVLKGHFKKIGLIEYEDV